MARVTITFDDDMPANAFAMWAETGEMLDAFNQSRHSTNLVNAGYGELSETDVTMDNASKSVEHEIEIR